AEQAGLAVRSERAVFVESVVSFNRLWRSQDDGIRLRVPGAQADAREQRNRPVLAPEIAPRHLNRSTRRGLEEIPRETAFTGRSGEVPALDAGREVHGRRR